MDRDIISSNVFPKPALSWVGDSIVGIWRPETLKLLLSVVHILFQAHSRTYTYIASPYTAPYFRTVAEEASAKDVFW